MSGELILPIPVTSMADYTDMMNGDERDLGKVKLIEMRMLPWLREKNKD